MLDITNPVFHDEEKARQFLESERWPDGRFMPLLRWASMMFASSTATAPWVRAGTTAMRCDQKKFTVRTDSIMERCPRPAGQVGHGLPALCGEQEGHLVQAAPAHAGRYATRPLGSSRMRIREAMKPTRGAAPLGGEGKVIESDETFVGGKKKNVHKGKPEPTQARRACAG